MLRQRVGSVLVFHNNVMHGSEGFERGQSDMPACLPASCMLSLPFSKYVSALTLPACPPAYMRAQLMIYIILVCHIERHVRWSIDLRYGPASQPFDWHGNPDWLEEWPPFVARVDDPLDEPAAAAAAAAADASGSDEKLQVTPWEEWERKWQTPRHTSGPRL